MDSNVKLKEFYDLCDTAEKQLQKFTKEINDLKSLDKKISSDLKQCEGTSSLRNENSKLKYQLYHLKKNYLEARCKKEEYTPSVLFILQQIFTKAIADAYQDSNLDLPEAIVQNCGSQSSHGDYQCNSSMGLYKIFKETIKEKTNDPYSIAQSIVNYVLQKPKDYMIENITIAKPAFINISLAKQPVIDIISQFIIQGYIAHPYPGPKYKAVVDLSSPNIAKEMHVGHLRSTIIGDSICRLFEYLGFEVLRINHIGDWGTQFGMLIAHLKDKFPEYLSLSPSIGNLQKFYKESKIRFDEDADFKKRAYQNVIQLQNKEPNNIAAWKLICDESSKEFQVIYDLLDVKLINRGESFYQEMMVEMVKELKAQNKLINEDGRFVLFVEGFDVPLIIQKSDGGFTYDTSDLASIKHRIHEEKGERLVYVVDSGQALHFNTLFAACRQLGWASPSVKLEHAPFGVVLGEDKKKFKTRSGDTVKLQDLIDEGFHRTRAKLIEKGRDKVLTREELEDAEKTLAISCIKYADLSNNRTKDYVFSFDKMLEDRGNTAAYLLYAYTRIKSIGRLAGYDRDMLRKIFIEGHNSKTSSYLRTLKDHDKIICDGPFRLNHDKEFKLAKILCRIGEVILQIQETLLIHTLCDYLYELSCVFTEFYDQCYCVEKDKSGNVVKVNLERLMLCEATALVMELCFVILGIKPVEKM